MRLTHTVAALAVMSLLGGIAPAVLADEATPPAYPTQEQVAAAQDEAALKAQSVAEIKTQLVLAAQRLDEAAVAAEQASERYNGAQWRLQQAGEALAVAKADAVQSRAAVDSQRDGIAALVTASYISGGNLQAVEAFVSPGGPEEIMDKVLAYEGASTSMEATYQRFQEASTLAKVLEQKAVELQARRRTAAFEARKRRDQAQAAAASAEQATARIESQKAVLVRRLAKAQGISVELAQQRQDALAAIAAQQAAEAAAKAAAELAAKQAAEAAAKAAAEAKAKEQKQQQPKATPSPSPTAPPTPGTPGAPTTPGPDPVPPTPSGGAAQAIAYAKAQLGEPYQWGAAGPDSWDCSGLMMKAWGSAGVSLPHYSAAQYSAGTPIGVGDLQPGDLVFWGTSSKPSSIHHVAMYLGNGEIIHAPRTGKPVMIESMYAWKNPNFFARL